MAPPFQRLPDDSAVQVALRLLSRKCEGMGPSEERMWLTEGVHWFDEVVATRGLSLHPPPTATTPGPTEDRPQWDPHTCLPLGTLFEGHKLCGDGQMTLLKAGLLANDTAFFSVVMEVYGEALDVSRRDVNGFTLLHVAVLLQIEEAVHLLCEAGASPLADDFEGKTCLEWARTMHEQVQGEEGIARVEEAVKRDSVQTSDRIAQSLRDYVDKREGMAVSTVALTTVMAELTVSRTFWPRYHFDLARMGSRIFVYGGCSGVGKMRCDLSCFYIQSNTWDCPLPQVVGEHPPPLRGHSLTAVPSKNLMVLFGGTDSSGTKSNNVWFLSLGNLGLEGPDLDLSWWRIRTSTLEGKPPALEGHAACADSTQGEEKVFVFGGEADIPASHVQPHAACDGKNGRRILMQSWDGQATGQLQSSLYVLSCHDQPSWSQVRPENTNSPWPLRRKGHSMCTLQSRRMIFMFGGTTFPNRQLNDLWTFDPTELVWSEVLSSPLSPSPRHSHVLCPLSEDHIIVLGGEDSVGKIVDEDLAVFDGDIGVWQRIHIDTGFPTCELDTSVRELATPRAAVELSKSPPLSPSSPSPGSPGPGTPSSRHPLFHGCGSKACFAGGSVFWFGGKITDTHCADFMTKLTPCQRTLSGRGDSKDLLSSMYEDAFNSLLEIESGK